MTEEIGFDDEMDFTEEEYLEDDREDDAEIDESSQVRGHVATRCGNPEKERQILSLVLQDTGNHVEIMDSLRERHFVGTHRAKLFELIYDLYLAQKEINYESLRSMIELRVSASIATDLLNEYDEIVETTTKNTIQNILSDLEEMFKNRVVYNDIIIEANKNFLNNKPINDIIGQISDKLLSIEIGRKSVSTKDAVKDVVDQIVNPKTADHGLMIGITDIDQQFGGFMKDRYWTIGAESKAGKCLAKGTKVVMFDGSIKKVEDVVVGDKLMGPDSTPRNVLSLGRGSEMMYWVRQTNGIDYRVNEGHILSLIKKGKSKYSEKVKPNQSHISKNKRKREYSILSKEVDTVCNINIKDYLNLSKTEKRYLFGYKADGLEFENRRVTIDPYLLGIWLGDGSSHKSLITNVDPEVCDYLNEWSLDNGHKVSTYNVIEHSLSKDRSVGLFEDDQMVAEYENVKDASLKSGKSYSTVRDSVLNLREGYSGDFRHLTEMSKSLYELLKDYDLIKNKHIPEDYLKNSREVRFKLLAGLIDSDGHYFKNTFEITQKNKVLSDQIISLARSLGFKVSPSIKKVKGYGEYTRMSIHGDLELIPTKIERKKAKSHESNKNHLHTSIKVEQYKVDDYFGFTIDGDHLFLLEDLTVTHNTAIVCDWIHRLCDFHSEKIAILFFSCEMSEKRIVHRLISRDTGYSVQKMSGQFKTLTDEEKDNVVSAGEKVRDYPLTVEYGTTDVTKMKMKARRFALQNKGKHLFFILDHIGKISENANDLRHGTIKASSCMKSFCMDYNGTSITLTQLRKEIKSREREKSYHIPNLGDIMESGAIEADSDAIILAWRPDMRFTNIDWDGKESWDCRGKMIFLNEKNRDGQSPTHIILDHDIKSNKFENPLNPFE